MKAFLQLADSHPEWELCLIGHDSGDGCQALVEELIANSPARNRVHLLGSRDDLGTFMQSCGIYVHSSDVEGLPLAPQEAMYYGCPIIASDIPSHQELLEPPDCGLLFAKGDADNLACRLDTLMRDAALRETLCRNSRNAVIARGMTKSAMIANYSSLYQEFSRT